MGKRGSLLIHFIMEALISSKYINLQFENECDKVFSLTLPRKTKRLNEKYEQILKDWRVLKKQPYNYTKAKAAVESALKKSDFVELISSYNNKVICRILNEEEVTEKKRLRQAMASIKKEYNDPPSVDSSGYGSGEDGIVCEDEDSGKVIAVEHDHMSYSISPLCSMEWQNNQPFNHSLNENFSPLDVTDEATSFIKSEYSLVNPNTILVDQLNTQNAGFCGQMYGIKPMEVDNKEVLNPKEQNEDWSFSHYRAQSWSVVGLQNNPTQQNPKNTEVADSVVDDLFDLDLQDAFDDIPLDKLPCSPELDDVIKGIENSIPSNDTIYGIPQKIIYHLKESKTSEDEHIWIFEPENEELPLLNENGENINLSMIQNEELKRMLSCSMEVNLLNGQISVFIKHKQLGN